jgi:Leu/Phe-tRNA-protein transferase
MYKQPQIYYIESQKLQDKLFFESICSDMTNSYYWSDDWSEEFYITLAQKGFISTTYDTKDGLVLLPELEFDYAILDFENLHISKKVKKLLTKDDYKFSIDTRFDEVLESFDRFHKYNWLKGKYVELLKRLHKNEYENFKIISVEICSDSGELICGEVGYIVGQIYTSLSGFSSNEKRYDNYGTLQLVLLSKYLQDNGFAFWNLGHPHMPYKQKLGAKTHTRGEFLARWSEICTLPMINPSDIYFQ